MLLFVVREPRKVVDEEKVLDPDCLGLIPGPVTD